jgi:putative ABC transport system ATP-binding protein
MIEIKYLNKSYNLGKENGCEVLKDICLEIKKGEMVAIMGTSGAGKSTLLHILACIDDYDNGEYRLDGELIEGLSDRKMARLRNEKIGIVMQDFALVENFTALENVLIPLDFAPNGKRKGKKERKKTALQMLDLVHMGEYANKQVKKLSGGQKQRVAIARAIANNPDVILADEPTGALDLATTEEIMELFQQLNHQGNTIVMVTHDREVAEKCGRIVELRDGKICTA